MEWGEEEDEMNVGEGDGDVGEEEMEPPDWRVRAGLRSKRTHKEREEHEATHVPVRVWCAHCMMGGGRTQRHVTKQKSDDHSRRRTIAMDCYFIRTNSVAHSLASAEETVTRIAVKEDRHQTIKSTIVLRNGVEEPRAIEITARFINSLGFREIPLKSDTEPSILAFRQKNAAQKSPSKMQ